jgi:sortase A
MNRNKIIGLCLLLVGFMIIVTVLTHLTFYYPEKEMPVEKTGISFVQASTTYPTRISIPKINLDTEVESVGLTYSGNMSTPKKLMNTGWYKYGTVPGNKGSAVIDGHVDNGLGLAAVFKNLKQLAIGDDVYVKNNLNQELHFRVIDTQIYYYKDVPLTLMFNRDDGPSYLNLITCDGNWIPEEKTDDHRLVVYTKLVQ